MVFWNTKENYYKEPLLASNDEPSASTVNYSRHRPLKKATPDSASMSPAAFFLKKKAQNSWLL